MAQAGAVVDALGESLAVGESLELREGGGVVAGLFAPQPAVTTSTITAAPTAIKRQTILIVTSRDGQ